MVSNFMTILVLQILAIYFILTFWVFLSRFNLLRNRIEIESLSLKYLYNGVSKIPSNDSILSRYMKQISSVVSTVLEVAISDVLRVASKHFSFLSIVASTSPLIGLLGTIIGIFDALDVLRNQPNLTFYIVSYPLSNALVPLAISIVVSVFAYSFHLILKRQVYELRSLLTSQMKIVLSN